VGGEGRGGVSWAIHVKVDRATTMRWLRLVGSLKVKVFFAKEPCKRDDILQKRPIILRRLLLVATPYLNRKHKEKNIKIHSGYMKCF